MHTSGKQWSADVIYGNIINYLPYPVFWRMGNYWYEYPTEWLGGTIFLFMKTDTSDNHVYLNYSQIVGYDGEDIGLNGMSSIVLRNFYGSQQLFSNSRISHQDNTGLFLFQNRTFTGCNRGDER